MTHSIFNAYADNAIQHGSVASPHVGIAAFRDASLQREGGVGGGTPR